MRPPVAWSYHLTDNVAELAPFLLWALSGGGAPLALGVLQILALDIGTDMLPALALGAEPPSRSVLHGPARTGGLIDRRLLARAFGVLGPAEAVVELGAFLAVLHLGGWSWGESASPGLLAAASQGERPRRQGPAAAARGGTFGGCGAGPRVARWRQLSGDRTGRRQT